MCHSDPSCRLRVAPYVPRCLAIGCSVKNAKTSCDATCIATRKNLNDQIHTVVGETAFAKYHSIHLAQAQNYKNTHPAAGAQPAPAGQKSKAGSSSTGGSSAKKTDGVTKKKKPAGPTP